MKIIPLTKGQQALVDNEDFDYLSRFSWHVRKAYRGWYAARKIQNESGEWPLVFMHRELMGTPEDLDTDHRDRNGLNNQKGNLRVTTRSKNLANAGLRRDNTTGFKGVSIFKRDGSFKAQIREDGKTKHLGYFSTAEEAARAYDKAAAARFGEFAYLNFSLA